MGDGGDMNLFLSIEKALQGNEKRSKNEVAGVDRCAFNGQEHSTEIGEDDYTAQFWEYDSRIGRRWNTDPSPNVSFSSYVCFGDNPICYNDVLGDTPKKPTQAKSTPPLTLFGIPVFTKEFSYKLIHDIDLKYSKTRRGQLQSFTIPIPWTGRLTLMFFQYEADKTKQDKNAADNLAENPTQVGSNIPHRTVGHEVPYVSTKQGGRYAMREVTDARQNSGHGGSLTRF